MKKLIFDMSRIANDRRMRFLLNHKHSAGGILLWIVVITGLTLMIGGKPPSFKESATGKFLLTEIVATPDLEASVISGSKSKVRTFSLREEDGVFVPNTIVANKGDTVRIKFISTKKAYSVAIPAYHLQQSIGSWETKPIEFQATKEWEEILYKKTGAEENFCTGGYIRITDNR